jgi:hypothetical protein
MYFAVAAAVVVDERLMEETLVAAAVVVVVVQLETFREVRVALEQYPHKAALALAALGLAVTDNLQQLHPAVLAAVGAQRVQPEAPTYLAFRM